MPRVLRFQCDECGKSFSRSWDLKRHVMRHDPNAPKAKCPLCAFETLQMGNVKTHYDAVHLKLKDKQCTLGCVDKVYADAAALIRHEKKDHGYYRKANKITKQDTKKPYARPSRSGSRPTIPKQREVIDLTVDWSSKSTSPTPSLSSSSSSTSSPASFPSSPFTASTSLAPSPALSGICELDFGSSFFLPNSTVDQLSYDHVLDTFSVPASTSSSFVQPSVHTFDLSNHLIPNSVVDQSAYGQILQGMASSSSQYSVPESNFSNLFSLNSAEAQFSQVTESTVSSPAPSSVSEVDVYNLFCENLTVDQLAYKQVGTATAASSPAPSSTPELDYISLFTPVVDQLTYGLVPDVLNAPLGCNESWGSMLPTCPDFQALTADDLYLSASTAPYF